MKSIDDAVEWLKRAPFESGAEIEIRPVYETADFYEKFAPDDVELRQKEEEMRRVVESRRG